MTNYLFRFFLDFFSLQLTYEIVKNGLFMSSLEDELRFYLDNSLKEFFVEDNTHHRKKIDNMVLEIEKLFNTRNMPLEEQSSLYKISQNLIYNSLSRDILNGDRIVKLNNQEIALLEYFIQNRGTTISYETLIAVISNCLHKNSSLETLRTVIKRLRAKTDKSIIETFSKVGYRLLCL